MKIAYIVSAYRYPLQLVRLVRKLDAAGVAFFIHVDRNTEAVVFGQMRDGLAGRPNVVFLPRHRCHWGDFGHVRASLKGIEAILARGGAEQTVLLTGQDYPIKSNLEIADVLLRNREVSHVDSFPLPAAGLHNGGMDRIDRWHFHPGGRHVEFPGAAPFEWSALNRAWRFAGTLMPLHRTFPEGLQAFAGSSYWCLSLEGIEYVSDFVRRHPRYVRFFRHVRIPDEVFFQSLLLNSPLRARIVNDNHRYVSWDPDSPARPRDLTRADFDTFMASDRLFARKFDETVDPAVLDMIDDATG